MSINPLHFCTTKNGQYDFLENPVNYLSHTLSTDGIAILLSPIDSQYLNIQVSEKLRSSFFLGINRALDEIETAQLSPAPRIKLPPPDSCRSCSALIIRAPDLQTAASKDKDKLIFRTGELRTGEQSGAIMAIRD